MSLHCGVALGVVGAFLALVGCGGSQDVLGGTAPSGREMASCLADGGAMVDPTEQQSQVESVVARSSEGDAIFILV